MLRVSLPPESSSPILSQRIKTTYLQVTRHDALPLVIVDPAYQTSQAESPQDFTGQPIKWKCTDHDGKTKCQFGFYIHYINFLNDRSHRVRPNGQAVQFPQGAACPTIVVGIDVVNLTTSRRHTSLQWYHMGNISLSLARGRKIGHLPGSNLSNHCKH